jgi:hypothetical protein
MSDYDSAKKGSNRFATVFFYLSDVEEGGEVNVPTPQAFFLLETKPHSVDHHGR